MNYNSPLLFMDAHIHCRQEQSAATRHIVSERRLLTGATQTPAQLMNQYKVNSINIIFVILVMSSRMFKPVISCHDR
jgi:hypothetical protein